MTRMTLITMKVKVTTCFILFCSFLFLFCMLLNTTNITLSKPYSLINIGNSYLSAIKAGMFRTNRENDSYHITRVEDIGKNFSHGNITENMYDRKVLLSNETNNSSSNRITDNFNKIENENITVGILIPSSTRKLENPAIKNLALTKKCLPSIYSTVEDIFEYEIYIGIDKGDYLETVKEELEKFEKVKTVISPGGTFTKSVNSLARKAYRDGVDFLVRINDDSSFETGNWTSQGINVLNNYTPINIGVVGPTCHEGNTAILTHDMVHRTHLEIFDFYYPPYFDNWWADDWITRVYLPDRSTKLPSWIVKHHLGSHGTRYNVDFKQEARLEKVLAFDTERLNKFMSDLK